MVKKATKKKSVKKTTKKIVKKKKVVKTIPKVPDHTLETIPHQTKPNIQKKDRWFSFAFIVGLILIIILIIVLVPMGNNIESDVALQGPEVLLEGSYLAMDVNLANPSLGDEIQVRIRGENIEDLAGYQMSLYYNPDVLRYTSMRNGDFFGVMGERICIPPVPKGDSIQNIGCVKLPEKPGELMGVSGSGELALLNFEVIGRGNTNLKIDNILMPKSDKTHLDYQVAPFEPLIIK